MAYIDFERIKKAVMLEPAVYKEIAGDKAAMMQAVVVLYLASIIGNIWMILLSFGFMLVAILIAAPIGWVISTGILYILARLLGGKGDFEGYLKALGFAEAPMALGFIPFLGQFIGSIWSLACVVIATREVHKLSTGKAVLVVLIPLVVLLVLAGIFIMMVGFMMPAQYAYGPGYPY